MSFAFFGQTRQYMYEHPPLLEELRWMIALLETKMDIRFKRGYNPRARCPRLNTDPVHAVHHPFIFYMGVLALDAITKAVLYLAGFSRYGREARDLLHLTSTALLPAWELEEEDVYHQDSKSPKVAYWYRQGSVDQHPIVFIHGLGCGIFPYLNFIRKLLTTRSSVFLVELPHVSMRMQARAPTVPATIREMEDALTQHGYARAVWVGHSLGSTIVAGACRLAPKRVQGAVFLDPVCFLLNHHPVVYNFLYRPVVTAPQLFIRYFAASELFISRYISRQLHWYHAIGWASMLPKNASVFLAEDDVVVPSAQVEHYLKQHGVDCHLMKELGHSRFLATPEWENKVVESVTAFVSK
jgi:pimeloyl-ACP methyl ester carboxylesterase